MDDLPERPAEFILNMPQNGTIKRYILALEAKLRERPVEKVSNEPARVVDRSTAR